MPFLISDGESARGNGLMLSEEQEEPLPLSNRLLHQIVQSPSSWRPSGAGRDTSDRHNDIPELFPDATNELPREW